MKIHQDPQSDNAVFRISMFEMLHNNKDYFLELIIKRAANVFLENEKWLSWILKKVKTGQLVKMVQEKVSDKVAEKVLEKF